MRGVIAALEHLRDDQDFQKILKDEEVIAAMKHWTGEQRLSSGEATERFNGKPIIAEVLSKLHRLQLVCKQQGVGVPIQAVLAASTDPFYGINVPKDTEKAALDRGRSSDVPRATTAELANSPSWLELSLPNITFWWSFQVAGIAAVLVMY
mmetsp:Transcript_17019/g.31300  ORF Transcript_17019/g.31300 Transcript_17019/m.31300 type:complete len:151 (-) Transcript_17019:1028-1480(-)|eukprot:CAMPEP_0184525054 /NCGR_PEP_ID=MMETSP0198_2-20121128/9877_1 /TAXON_ID=1112570 /ORGANISM="Thraustochytrium sp., Strain LLF1b" /LENGTH=150 /DNA_ID=CAMNT_0026916455 /DNA_START=89 /DNA_END=544 /DNA_ORIENTATION=+